jgi:hypothetical protein
MRYNTGETAIVYTALYDENDNLITGASITGDLLRPDGSVSGPYILNENTNFPGLYSIELQPSILNQIGHYTMRLIATDFPVQFVSFFVGRHHPVLEYTNYQSIVKTRIIMLFQIVLFHYGSMTLLYLHY